METNKGERIINVPLAKPLDQPVVLDLKRKGVGNGFIERTAAKKLSVETNYSNSILLVLAGRAGW